MQDTRIWISPALCGCEIEMDAYWTDKPIVDAQGRKTSYLHPSNGSMENLRIVNVCATHDHFRTDPFPADPYYGCIGYLPIKGREHVMWPVHPLTEKALVWTDPLTATEAERLYVQLGRYDGGTERLLTCGCSISVVSDRETGTRVFVEKPGHTIRCDAHKDDTDHSIAKAEQADVEKMVQHLVQSKFKELTDIQVPTGKESDTLADLDAIEPSTVNEAKFKEELNKAVGELYDKISFSVSPDRTKITISHPLLKFLPAQDATALKQAGRGKLSAITDVEFI